MANLRVLIIETPLLSQAVSAAIPAETIISAPDAAQALAHLAGQPPAARPTALILDLPEQECLATLSALSANPALALLVHLRSADERFIVQAVQAGVAGFITQAEQIADALQAIERGEPYLPPGLAGNFVRGLRRAYRTSHS